MQQTLPTSQAHGRAELGYRAASLPAASCPEVQRKVDAPAVLRLWHLTSLDAPTVAVVWALGFAWAAGVRLPLWVPALLALAGWVAYVGDRLLDARSALMRGAKDALRERHRFHHRHRRVLAPLAVLALCAGACIVFGLMPAPARARNGLLACAGLAYFAVVHVRAANAAKAPAPQQRTPSTKSPALSSVRLFRKELLVGVLFTAACALPALSRMWTASAAVPRPLLAAATVFALLAWLNCHAIDRWEDSGCNAGPRIVVPAALLALAAGLLAVGLAAQQPRAAALLAAAAASALLLALLDLLQSRLAPLALRALADVVLLTPLGLLAYAEVGAHLARSRP